MLPEEVRRFETASNDAQPLIANHDRSPTVDAMVREDVHRLPLQDHEVLLRPQREAVLADAEWKHPSAPAVLRRGKGGPLCGQWIDTSEQACVSSITLEGFTRPLKTETSESDQQKDPRHLLVMQHENSLSSPSEYGADADVEWPHGSDTIGTRPTVCSDGFDLISPPKPRKCVRELEAHDTNLPPSSEHSSNAAPESPVAFPSCENEYPAVNRLKGVNAVTTRPSLCLPNIDEVSPESGRSRPGMSETHDYEAVNFPLRNLGNASGLGSLRGLKLDPAREFHLGRPTTIDNKASRPSACSNDVGKMDRRYDAATPAVEFPLNAPMEYGVDHDVKRPASGQDAVTSTPTNRSKIFRYERYSPQANLSPNKEERNNAARESLIEFPLRALEQPALDGCAGVNVVATKSLACLPNVEKVLPRSGRMRPGMPERQEDEEAFLPSHSQDRPSGLGSSREFKVDSAWGAHLERPTTIDVQASRPSACSNDVGKLNRRRQLNLASLLKQHTNPDMSDSFRLLSTKSNRPREYCLDHDVELPSGSNALASGPKESARYLSYEPDRKEANLSPNRVHGNTFAREFPLCAFEYPAGNEFDGTNVEATKPSACLPNIDKVSPQSGCARPGMPEMQEDDEAFMPSHNHGSRSGLSSPREFKLECARDIDLERPTTIDAQASTPPARADDVGKLDFRQHAAIPVVAEQNPLIPVSAAVRFPFQWIDASQDMSVSDISMDFSEELSFPSMNYARADGRRLQEFPEEMPTTKPEALREFPVPRAAIAITTTQPDACFHGRNAALRTTGVVDNALPAASFMPHEDRNGVEHGTANVGRVSRNTSPVEFTWNPHDAGKSPRAMMSMGVANDHTQQTASPSNIQANIAPHHWVDSHESDSRSTPSRGPDPAGMEQVLEVVPTAGRARCRELLRQHSLSTVIMILLSEV